MRAVKPNTERRRNLLFEEEEWFLHGQGTQQVADGVALGSRGRPGMENTKMASEDMAMGRKESQVKSMD
jgi:hypothetical protein